VTNISILLKNPNFSAFKIYKMKFVLTVYLRFNNRVSGLKENEIRNSAKETVH